MLTTIEKVIILQDVDFFEFTPTEGLAIIATITQELHVKSGATIYEEGDPPDAIYLIVDGKVRLHRDGEEISVVSNKQGFGTWALFDGEPRLASATAVDDSHILRISKEDFLDVLSDHTTITESVFRALVKQIRGLVEGRLND